ncbi:hypothetical protein EDB81DRAFT_788860 [Dactylonectria macrodidyma]|uniref:Uncharacterized protein n=1 Tax=Dactylonectria macrodidyma TaxID=307937 RepID=A0A9P9F822_9HYPO|nr:hypothetical protein EDB81DRAFT_788860 [Dactylonectria macrodidyma]
MGGLLRWSSRGARAAPIGIFSEALGLERVLAQLDVADVTGHIGVGMVGGRAHLSASLPAYQELRISTCFGRAEKMRVITSCELCWCVVSRGAVAVVDICWVNPCSLTCS